MTAFLRDVGQFAFFAVALVLLNAHELQPINGIGWLVLLLAVIGVPYMAWSRLTVGGRDYARRSDERLRGAYGIYVRSIQRFTLLVMAPAFAVCWFQRSINNFIWVWLGTILAVYLYAVFVDRHARNRSLAR